ncbi:MAG: hypothetical protein WCF78_02840 [archaeon]
MNKLIIIGIVILIAILISGFLFLQKYKSEAVTREFCEAGNSSYGVNIIFGTGVCVCGGIAGFGCPDGYTCKMQKNPTTSDSMGTCIKQKGGN